jgi:hypothetical protein
MRVWGVAFTRYYTYRAFYLPGVLVLGVLVTGLWVLGALVNSIWQRVAGQAFRVCFIWGGSAH